MRTVVTLARVVFVALPVAISCSGGRDSAPTPPATPTAVLTTLSVTLSTTTLQVGQTTQASAAGLDQNGAPIATGTISWSSSSPNIATIASSGAISAVAVGQTQILGSVASTSGQATLTVAVAPVASVTIVPSSVTMPVGGSQQLSASAFDVRGSPLTGRAVAWSTTDATKATVSSSGLVTGVGAGVATVTATSEGKQGVASIVVTTPLNVATISLSPGTRLDVADKAIQLAADVRDAAGKPVAGASLVWSIVAPTGAASISQLGLVTPAGTVGTVRVSATAGNAVGQAVLSFTTAKGTGPSVSLYSEVANVELNVGDDFQLLAIPKDANGHGTPATTTWSTADASIATVTSSGLVHAVGQGRVRIYAQTDNRQSWWGTNIAVGSRWYSSILPVAPWRLDGSSYLFTFNHEPLYAYSLESVLGINQTAQLLDAQGRSVGGPISLDVTEIDPDSSVRISQYYSPSRDYSLELYGTLRDSSTIDAQWCLAYKTFSCQYQHATMRRDTKPATTPVVLRVTENPYTMHVGDVSMFHWQLLDTQGRDVTNNPASTSNCEQLVVSHDPLILDWGYYFSELGALSPGKTKVQMMVCGLKVIVDVTILP